MYNLPFTSLRTLHLKVFFALSFCIFFLFLKESSAEKSIEGSVRARAVFLPETHDSTFFFRGRINIKGEFYPSNKFKPQIHFTASNYKDFNLRKAFKIYPSINWFITENLEFQLGRIFYQNRFHQIVSLNDYEPFSHTFDGMFLKYNTKNLDVSFWGAYLPYLPSRDIGDFAVQKFRYGAGFFLDISALSNFIDYFNIYAMYLNIKERSQMSRYGLGWKGIVNPLSLNYTVIIAGHGQGIQFKPEENMYHIHLSYSYVELFDSKIFIGYHTDSSDYKFWLYDRHKNAGLLNMFLWGNLTYYFVGFSSSFAGLFDLQVSFYDFRKTGKGSVQWAYYGHFLRNKSQDNISNKTMLGRELDIQLKKQISEELEIRLLAGVFVPHLDIQLKKLLKSKDFFSNVQLTGLYKF